ncbi:SRPBCC family protein [Nocardioides caldifontis]|uniref:SRPBCC family protein n=1 Tax=Nocardioides caldifontis TaxID=2588938 RepID=UPI0011DFD0C3|nr:SRPBCC family protein [Nocardioides caldifontis]
MAGRELTVTRVVHASPEEVWRVLTDLEGAPRTLRGVTRVEVLEGASYDVGTRWAETRRILGKEETQTMEVTGSDPPRRTVIESRSTGVLYRTVFTLEPIADGTELSVCFGASHPDPTLLQRVTVTVFGRVGAALTSRLLNQDLEDIARRAESSSAD